jgi:flagellar L-ring protein precursor FlgH
MTRNVVHVLPRAASRLISTPLLTLTAALCLVAGLHAANFPGLKKKPPKPSLLDKYIQSAAAGQQNADAPSSSPGAIWSPAARLSDLARDLRASQVNDIVTVVVNEATNAVSSGVTQTQRASTATDAIPSLLGIKSPTGALANLLNQSGNVQLNGTGTTSRTATLTAVLTARVVSVLPGGLLLIEGDKNMQVNSEQQVITVRGIVRTADISTSNTVASTQVADMELLLNGKGVVGDAIRRPNVLYRFLLGLLPF